MEYLGNEYLKNNGAKHTKALGPVFAKRAELPEKVIQFGEGAFLRAFVDDFIDDANRRNIFNGRVVVVQPIAQGRIDELTKQDMLYTLVLRGLENGKPVDRRKIVSCLSRGLKAYGQWPQVLACAAQESIDVVISNTTEAGIVFDETDRIDADPPRSYPGKLTALLHHRWKHFNGAPERGLLIIPVELIDKNADTLKSVVLKLCTLWKLEKEFVAWVTAHNTFCNSLVDRIVTGHPGEESVRMDQELGYYDKGLNTAEPFHLWAIEGDQDAMERFPLCKTADGVIFTDDYAPYRDRKVRILNGSHTALGPTAFLAGQTYVKNTIEDETFDTFWKALLFDEIIPSLPYPEEDMETFAFQVMERFKNPFLKHEWKKILLNSTSKVRARLVPSILAYHKKNKTCPRFLAFSLAAFLRYMLLHDKTANDNSFWANDENGDPYRVDDDAAAGDIFLAAWQNRNSKQRAVVTEVVSGLLKNKTLWDADLHAIPGLADQVTTDFLSINEMGMREALEKVLA
jgi:tagaturonate reductase